ncbi:MAG: L-aspartate oxidase [Proteobacteria bacterium]|nr:L-aspartate oxidase [Pseudomonadota bacterium]
MLRSSKTDDVIIVGSGLAGLVCALQLTPRPVTLITKTPQLGGGSSILAKGGIAAAIGPGDSSAHHAQDTLSAGAGLSDAQAALQLSEDGVESLQFLLDAGVAFDRSQDGGLQLAQEAAHRYPRVIHAGGDATGHFIMKCLIERVRAIRSIQVLENTFAHDLLIHGSRVRGLVAYTGEHKWVCYQASHVVIATGGIGMSWWHTTNPQESTGDGLAMAARAGARLADLEFVQFHPTALAIDGNNGASLPLLTEALRGAGAFLVDESGHRFMQSEHSDTEMAPRDVVARAIEKRTTVGQRVFLDVRPVINGGKAHLFPQAMTAARKAGFDPGKDPLPVTSAAHYHMGGVETDDRGRTSIDGLWACGEVATTGIHGANRLASNSLLEALVYARRVATEIARSPAVRAERPAPPPAEPRISPDTAPAQVDDIIDSTRKIMSQNVGVLRCGDGLASALSQLSELDRDIQSLLVQGTSSCPPSGNRVIRWSEARNLLLVARMVTQAALQRTESRGAHYRDDYPAPAAKWKRRQSLTVDQLDAA